MAKRRERVPGRITRTLKSAWLGGRVTTSYLGGKLAAALRGKDTDGERHATNARRIAETLGELRGPLMKIGQILSTHAQALPDEYGGVLRSLQASAPPMSFDAIRDVLEADLGAPVDECFAELSREAVAAASLGQVHRGRLHDGTEVAVKVQYPGAEESVRADLSNMEAATRAIKRLLADALGKPRFDVTPIAEELAEHLMQETDYCREAYNAKLLARLFEGDGDVVVPRVHDACSGLRVVTYDWIDGVPLDAALRDPDVAVRERVVLQLTHLLWHQFFRGGLLHADPHPGNFVVLADGRLGLLDYGCVKIFGEPFLRGFGAMMRASLEEDEERLRDAYVELGFVSDRADEEEIEDVDLLSRFFSMGAREDEVFDFAELDYVGAGRELVMHFVARRQPPPSQRDVIFLSRVLVGYYEYFSRAGVKLNLHRVLLPYVERGYTGRAIEIPPYG